MGLGCYCRWPHSKGLLDVDSCAEAAAEAEEGLEYLKYRPGVRRMQTSIAGCLATSLGWPIHNETLNIWTSILAWPMHAFLLGQAELVPGESQSAWHLAALVRFTCCCVGWLGVGLYHALLCHQDRALVDQFRLADFAGCFLQGYGLGTALLFSVSLNWPTWLQILSHTSGTAAIAVTSWLCIDLSQPFRWRLIFLVAAAGIYVGLVLFATFANRIPGVISEICYAALSVGIGLAFLRSFMPERIWPESWLTNCVFQSHVLWHLGVLGYNYFLVRASFVAMQWWKMSAAEGSRL